MLIASACALWLMSCNKLTMLCFNQYIALRAPEHPGQSSCWLEAPDKVESAL